FLEVLALGHLRRFGLRDRLARLARRGALPQQLGLRFLAPEVARVLAHLGQDAVDLGLRVGALGLALLLLAGVLLLVLLLLLFQLLLLGIFLPGFDFSH